MTVDLRIQEASIVLRGAFSPAVFQPAWLAANELIRKQEADSAKIDLIHAKVAQFAIGDWCSLVVTEDRLQASTTLEAYYDPLRDLVLGIIDLLGAAPLRQLGMNGQYDFEFSSTEEWHAVGHRLAPKEPWRGLLQTPGMLNLVMQGERPDGMAGYQQAHVSPCNAFPFGIRVHINDHYEFTDDARKADGTREVVRVLAELWRGSLTRALDIAWRLVREQG